MTNRTIEAQLRISAKVGNLASLDRLSKKMNDVERAANRFNRASGLMATAASGVGAGAMAAAGRLVGPAALAYGAGQAFKQFAEVERQLSRTGIKLGATRDEVAALQADMTRISGKFALPAGQLLETVDAIAESGGTLADVRAELEGIAKAQQGLGAGGAEVVSTWDAAKRSLGLATKDAERFFDRIAAGGAGGKFEGSDLARYLPSILPIAASRGFDGMAGVEQIVGGLEAIRDFVGSSEEAAASMSDFLEKVASPDVERNFKKMGVDLPKGLKAAKRDGVDLFTAMSRMLSEATGGDIDKLGYLFGDKEARRFARLLMQDLDALNGKIDTIRTKSDGMISGNVDRVLQDAKASVDQLGNAWDAVVLRMGKAVSVPLVPILKGAVKEFDDGMAEAAGRKKLRDSGRDEGDYLRQFIQQYAQENPDAWFTSYAGNQKFIKALRALGRGDIENIFDVLPEDLPKDVVSPGGPLSRPGRGHGRAHVPVPTPRPKRRSEMTLNEKLAADHAAARYVPAAGEDEGIVARRRSLDAFLDGPPASPKSSTSLDTMLAGMDKAADELRKGGQDSAAAIEDGGRAGAEAFVAILNSVAPSIGSVIGQAVAAAVRANIGTITVKTQAQGQQVPLASGNKGVSMPDAGRSSYGGPR